MPKIKNILNPYKWTELYADGLFSYAYSKTGDNNLSEDLVQETFLAGLNAQKNFKGQCTEKTWLYAILKFKIADYYRKASTKYEVSNLNFPEDEGSHLDTFFTEDGNWKENASPRKWQAPEMSGIENKELAKALNFCIDNLPENQKQLILLKLVEEEKTEVVCKELNIAPTNYWVIIHRAKLQLRACLEKNWLKE